MCGWMRATTRRIGWHGWRRCWAPTVEVVRKPRRWGWCAGAGATGGSCGGEGGGRGGAPRVGGGRSPGRGGGCPEGPPPPPMPAFTVLKRRWVVERTFAWLDGYRRLSKDYEFLPESS